MKITQKIFFIFSLAFLAICFCSQGFGQANQHFEGMLHYTVKHGESAKKTDYPTELKLHVTQTKLRVTATTFFGYVIYIFDSKAQTGVRLYDIYGDKYAVNIPFSRNNDVPDAFVDFPKGTPKEIQKYDCDLVTIERPGITYKGWFPNEIHISDDVTELAPYIPYGLIQPYKKVKNRLFFELSITHEAEEDKILKLIEFSELTPVSNLFDYQMEDFEVVSQQKIQETLASLSDWKQY